MRDQLIELISRYDDLYDCGECDRYSGENCGCKCLADYLLENGVSLSPCKVGDNVYNVYEVFNEYLVEKLKVVELTIDRYGIKTLYGMTPKGSIYCFDRDANLDQIKFTKEEVEQALKGGADNGKQ